MDNNSEVAVTTTPGTESAAAARDRSARASHLYDAECALHAARQTHVDAWIAVAAERLHEAVVGYLAAVAGPTPGADSGSTSGSVVGSSPARRRSSVPHDRDIASTATDHSIERGRQ